MEQSCPHHCSAEGEHSSLGAEGAQKPGALSLPQESACCQTIREGKQVLGMSVLHLPESHHLYSGTLDLPLEEHQKPLLWKPCPADCSAHGALEHIIVVDPPYQPSRECSRPAS